ncbi:c-type cytochrome [Oligoflexia bacterium]|nr:c-type cytochrome [Oligoflexia bacterium]
MITPHDKLLKVASIAGLALVGLVMLFLFALIILPGSKDSKRVHFAKKDPTDIQPYRGKTIPPINVAEALVASKPQLTEGKGLYTAQCGSCHGAEGLGNGPAGAALKPPPRNFTSSEGWKKGFKVTQIFDTLSEGVGSMPTFDYLTPAQRFSLAHYVQALGKFFHGPEEEGAATYLNGKYQLDQESREPHKVALSFVSGKLLGEYKVWELAMPQQDDASVEAKLVQAVILKPERVAAVLSNLSAWREDSLKFLQIASSDAPTNGFAPKVGSLTPSELEALRAYIKQHLKAKK